MKTKKESYFAVLIIFLLIISTSILLYEGIGKSDTVEFTPMLYRELNENYLTNDWYVNANDHMFNVRLNFIRLIKFFISLKFHYNIISLFIYIHFYFGIIHL